jgi:hypothetical protein
MLFIAPIYFHAKSYNSIETRYSLNVQPVWSNKYIDQMTEKGKGGKGVGKVGVKRYTCKPAVSMKGATKPGD